MSRICGKSDNHKIHQCVFGHQVRGISGITIKNNEASIIRCEDVSDSAIIRYNGNDMTWLEFKEYYRDNKFNPWNFDDILKTKTSLYKNKFETVWNLIGEKICKELYEKEKINFVSCKDENFKKQFNQAISQKNYLFMIDTSRSITEETKKKLIERIIEILKNIANSSKKHKVSILSFSDDALFIEENKDPVTITKSLSANIKFKNCKTNYEKAFSTLISVLKKTNSEMDNIVILMSPGYGFYPSNTIENLKKIRKDETKKLKFYGIKFAEQIYESYLYKLWKYYFDYEENDLIEKITKEVNGEFSMIKEIEDLEHKSLEIFK